MMAVMIIIAIVITNSTSIAFMGVGYACLGLISPLEWGDGHALITMQVL
jgi:hypothetical protein